MTRFVLPVLALFCIAFTVTPALARDPAKDLCHRHCAGEYDKYVQAKDAQSKHEKNIDKKKQEIDSLKSKVSNLVREARALRSKCDKLFDARGGAPNDKAKMQADLNWNNCERDSRNLNKEINKLDSDIADAEGTLEYMKGKQKKFEDATQAAEDAYDDCMEKCMKDPKIQEKIPDSVIGDLEPLNKIPRKGKNPSDRTVKAGGGAKKASSADDGLPPPKGKEARAEPPPAKCPECAKLRETELKDAGKELDDIQKIVDEIEDGHYKLLAEQSLKHEMLQEAKGELKALGKDEIRKRQGLESEIERLQKDLSGLKKEVDASRKRLDGWKGDLKKAEKRYERAMLDLFKCNEKSCPLTKESSQTTPDDRKSLIKSILGGVSINVGGGHSDHGETHHDRYEHDNIEWEHE